MWAIGVEGDLYHPHQEDGGCDGARCIPMETGKEGLDIGCPVGSGYAWAFWQSSQIAHIVHIEHRWSDDRTNAGTPIRKLTNWDAPWTTICRGASLYQTDIEIHMSRLFVPPSKTICVECLARHP